MTLEVDRDIRKMAIEMQDTKLTAKLTAGDMVATEAKYHSKCILAFKQKHTTYVSSCSEMEAISNSDNVLEARAFAELISFMEVSAEMELFCLSCLIFMNCMFHVYVTFMLTRLSTKPV